MFSPARSPERGQLPSRRRCFAGRAHVRTTERADNAPHEARRGHVAAISPFLHFFYDARFAPGGAPCCADLTGRRHKKKARIARIRAYRNYFCHAVLNGIDETGDIAGGSRYRTSSTYVVARRSCSSCASTRLMRGRMPPLRRLVSLPVGPCPNVARDIAAQIATRRRRCEILIARFRLLPRLKRGRLLRPPVPALRSLLRECSRSEQ